ncbi:MAG: hypothetical protein ABSA02_08765 [Trebonia sp.]|jgi:hypothetical protein
MGRNSPMPEPGQPTEPTELSSGGYLFAPPCRGQLNVALAAQREVLHMYIGIGTVVVIIIIVLIVLALRR